MGIFKNIWEKCFSSSSKPNSYSITEDKYNETLDKLQSAYRNLGEQYQELQTANEEIRAGYDELVALRDVLLIQDKQLFESQQVAHLGHYSFRLKESEWECSPMLDTIFGISDSFKKDLHSWISLIHPDDQEPIIKYFIESVIKDEIPFDKEYRIVRFSDKKVRWVHGIGNLKHDENGAVSELFGIIQDITEKKSFEQTIQQRNVELTIINNVITKSTQSSDLHELLENLLDETLKIVDLEGGTICLINEDETFNLVASRETSEETIRDIETNKVKVGDCLCGNCARTQCPLILYDKTAVLKYASREVLRGENIQFHAAFPFVVKKKTRGILCLFSRTEKKPEQRMLDIIELISSHMAVVVENYLLVEQLKNQLSEQAETVEKLHKATEQAQESDRLKTVFLQNMSHEIRTPMNAIMGFADLLPQYFNDKETLADFTNIIKQRSSDLLVIINEILDISLIEAGQLPICKEECDIDELLTEIYDFFEKHSRKIGKAHIRLSKKLIGVSSKNMIITDKTKLKQIFINLIYNAYKFTNSGEIRFGCKNIGFDKIEFFVSDTGDGIPKEKQKFVFERFTQVTGATKVQGGTGLGLAIVKGLVSILEGCIEIESEIGLGSEFRFTIPYVCVTKKPNIPQFEEPLKSTNIFEGMTVLIVEDDDYNAAYLFEVLSKTKAKIYHVTNGQEAIELIKKNNTFDIVLMDIKLPDIDGYTVTKEIKQIRPELKVIAQTAYASDNDKQRTYDSGCIDFISKPIDKGLLMKKMTDQLSHN